MQQKVSVFFLIVLVFLGVDVRADIDPIMTTKIKEITKDMVQEENTNFYGRYKNNKKSRFGQRLNNLSLRLSNMENSLAYFRKISKKIYRDSLMQYREQIAQSCCVLHPYRLSDDQSWIYGGNGRKKGFKGKRFLGGGDDDDGGGGGGILSKLSGGGGGKGSGKGKGKKRGGKKAGGE